MTENTGGAGGGTSASEGPKKPVDMSNIERRDGTNAGQTPRPGVGKDGKK